MDHRDERDDDLSGERGERPEGQRTDDRVAEERAADARELDRQIAVPKGSEEVGEAIGGVGGVLAGAAVGTAIGGPVGTVIGGIAGAIGGWWAGREVADSVSGFSAEADERCRAHFESSENRPADRSYEDYRPVYQLGYVASFNPEYANRSFDEVEPELQAGWSDDLRQRCGEWSAVRPYAREAFVQERERRVQPPSTAPHNRTHRTDDARDALELDDTNII